MSTNASSSEAGRLMTRLAVWQYTLKQTTLSALQNVVAFGVGFPSMKTGGSKSFSSNSVCRKVAFLLVQCKTKPAMFYMFMRFISFYFVCVDNKIVTKSGEYWLWKLVKSEGLIEKLICTHACECTFSAWVDTHTGYLIV